MAEPSVSDSPSDLVDLVQYQEGAIVSRVLAKDSSGTVTAFAFDAGQGLSEHTAPYDAVVEILDGSAEITVGGETFTAKTGELVIMPADMPHALHGEVRFKMLLTMIRA